MTMGVNHLGHFYLTSLLWPLITKASQPRVINVSSTAHRGAGFMRKYNSIDFGDMNLKKTEYSWKLAYSRSKMANILFTNELQTKMNSASFKGSTYSLHPGVIPTDIIRDTGIWSPIVKFLFVLVGLIFFKNDREGAQTTLHLILSE